MLFHIHKIIGQSKYLKSQGISNLRLASRAVRGEPVFPFSAALRAAESIGKIPESLIVVETMGLEPTTFCACPPTFSLWRR
jgi:hypothetical protein